MHCVTILCMFIQFLDRNTHIHPIYIVLSSILAFSTEPEGPARFCSRMGREAQLSARLWVPWMCVTAGARPWARPWVGECNRVGWGGRPWVQPWVGEHGREKNASNICREKTHPPSDINSICFLLAAPATLDLLFVVRRYSVFPLQVLVSTRHWESATKLSDSIIPILVRNCVPPCY